MKDIKFRAWSVSNKKMHFVSYGLGSLETNGAWWEVRTNEKERASSIFHDILMQYTGLTDKNGKEIYEGDIVLCRAGEHEQGVWEYSKKVKVVFGWTVQMWDMMQADEIEIIGNIYENPELMED